MGPRRHRRARSITRLALTAVALTACAVDGTVVAEISPDRPDTAVPGVVSSVIDGDSLRVEVDGTRLEVRLAGINAPEADECHADRSRQYVTETVEGTVWIEVVGTDQFGRSLAGVWTESGFLNEAIVAEGGALAMTDDTQWASDLIDAEETARGAGLGMWSPTACGESVAIDIDIEMTAPDPPGPDNEVLDDEIVTLRNTGSATIDLTGFVLRDESSVNRLQLPNGTTIPSGGALEIASGCAPRSGLGWCAHQAIWNNGGDSALLVSPGGTIVAHVRYAPSR